MEERVCKNLWRGNLIRNRKVHFWTKPILGQEHILFKGFIRTMPDDNPYDDLESADGCTCKEKEGVKTLKCMAKLKEAERKAANAAKREAKKNKKQTPEDAE